MERFDVDVRNPMYEDPDDSRCYTCGAKLAEDPYPGTLEFDGYCSEECKRGEPVPSVWVRWEGDDFETEIECTRAEYEGLKKRVEDAWEGVE